MASTISNPEEFILDPKTVSLVLENGMITTRLLEQQENVLVGKPISGGVTVVYTTAADLDKVLTNVENYTNAVYPYTLGLLGTQELDASGITQVQKQQVLSLRGSGVLLGFVDTGIDYTLDTFLYEDGTSKIQYIWDQTIRGGNPPADYLFGTEYNNEIINTALKSENPFDVVPHKDTVGHGTFLASIAGGREVEGHLGAAPDSDMIIVKLKKASPFYLDRHLIPRDQENAYQSDDFMLGIQYVIDKAHALNRPIAICVALGSNLGIHNGFSRTEDFLTTVSGNKGVAICAAAGNEAQAAHHTMGKLPAAGASQNIELRAGDGLGDIYLFIVNYASDRMSVAVKSPSGEQINRVPARSGTSYESRLVLEKSTVIIQYIFPIEASGEQVARIRILAATPGLWTITVYGDSILDGTYHAYLPVTGFIDPATKFISPNPNYTIVTPATAYGIITCGAYNSKDGSISATSSRGPTLLPMIMPDLVAPGVNVGGWYPTGPGTMSGTSAAAAITAGACALMLQWGIVENFDNSLDSYRIRANLIGGCKRDALVDYPDNSWGYGKLDLYNTFQSLRPK